MSAPTISAFGKYSASVTHSSPVGHPKERMRRASGAGAAKNLRVAIERGAVRPLMATGMQQRGRLRELAPLKIINDAFSAHTAPENAVT
jgi:hypothetical protein